MKAQSENDVAVAPAPARHLPMAALNASATKQTRDVVNTCTTALLVRDISLTVCSVHVAVCGSV
jgi:hypothetical protein